MMIEEINDTKKNDSFFFFPYYKPSGTSLDDMLKNVKEVVEIQRYLFSGFQFTYHNLLDKKFYNTHTFHFGKIDPAIDLDDENNADVNVAWYGFGGIYKDDKQSLVGRITTQGNTTASYCYNGDLVKFNFKGQYAKKIYAEGDIALNLSGSWVELKASNTYIGFGFTTPLTKSISFGSEMLISPVSYLISQRYILQYKGKVGKSKYSGVFSNLGSKTDIDLYYEKKS